MTSQIPEYRGCPWPMDAGCADDAWNAYDDGVKDRALNLASSSLEALTGFRVGNCPITVRPSGREGVTDCSGPFPGESWGAYGMYPRNWNGAWSNGDGSGLCEVDLPMPVGRIDEVRVDGDTLDASDYRLDNGHLLVWQGAGDCPFPLRQDMSLPDTEPGTMSVTYLNAYPVDSNGAYAVGLLAREFAAACTDDSECVLPSGVISIVRQGISIAIAPGSFPDGNTGIREVDAYIRAWNPRHLIAPMAVWSPGMRRPRTTSNGGVPRGRGPIILDGGDEADWEAIGQ